MWKRQKQFKAPDTEVKKTWNIQVLRVKLLFENNQFYTFLFLKPRCQNKTYTIQLIRHPVAQILQAKFWQTPST